MLIVIASLSCQEIFVRLVLVERKQLIMVCPTAVRKIYFAFSLFSRWKEQGQQILLVVNPTPNLTTGFVKTRIFLGVWF